MGWVSWAEPFTFTVLFLNGLSLYLETFLCTPHVLYVSNSVGAISSDLTFEMQLQAKTRGNQKEFVCISVCKYQYLYLSRKVVFHSRTQCY